MSATEKVCSGDNAPFVRHLLPEGGWVLVNVAWRENGLIVAHGNPRRIRGVRDLARRGMRIVNRQRDAGTRVLLMRELRRAGIDPASVRGFERCVATHGAVADTIALGLADAGPGLRAAAAARGLDFVPLAPERYDIAFPCAIFDSRPAVFSRWRRSRLWRCLHWRRAKRPLPAW